METKLKLPENYKIKHHSQTLSSFLYTSVNILIAEYDEFAISAMAELVLRFVFAYYSRLFAVG